MSQTATKRIIPIYSRTSGETIDEPKPFGSGLTQPPPLSLYIHVPWCIAKCPYCDFNSHAVTEALPEQDYLTALVEDLEAALPAIWGRPVHSVFIGGGTPSLLSGRTIDALLTAVRMRLPLLPGAEVTLEANPGTVEAARLQDFRSAGVTRLSLGIQSFEPRHLQGLGRIHSATEALRACELAVQLFPTCNFDLIYGLPQQTLSEAAADIETALSFAPGHLSCYQLTIEPHTAFGAAPPPLPDPDQCADMQDQLEAKLAQRGWQHYETSAFARPGHRCQHNLNYWQFGDYLGIGAGAHSKLSNHEGIVRQMRWKNPRDYLARRGLDAIAEQHSIAREDLPFEFMMNALRLVDGFDSRLYAERTGLPWLTVQHTLKQAIHDELLEVFQAEITTPGDTCAPSHHLTSGQHVRPTPRGRRFLNPLLERFLV